MAVQAQYPSNVLFLLNRSEPERKEMDYPQPPTAFIDQSTPVFFSSSHGAIKGNTRKRGREAAAPTATAIQMAGLQSHPNNLFSLQSQPSLPVPTLINLAQLQTNPPPPIVSTGLRLAFEEQNQSNALLSTFLSDDLAVQINQQKDEIEQFLLAQSEQLRRTLAERRQRHYRALLGAAEESAARRLREKDVELERALRRSAELEDRLARLRAESMAWQARAMNDQETAASLHAQLHQLTVAAAAGVGPGSGAGDECGDSPAEDAESAHIDPDRVEDRVRTCRACRSSAVSVVLLPCRHLCLCPTCDAATTGDAGERCPICRCVRTGSVQVFFS